MKITAMIVSIAMIAVITSYSIHYTKLYDIAGYMNVSSGDYESIQAMFTGHSDAAYKILEIDPQVSDDEVKKAYREMAKKYHPDKVGYLGEDFKKVAHEKFQKVLV